MFVSLPGVLTSPPGAAAARRPRAHPSRRASPRAPREHGRHAGHDGEPARGRRGATSVRDLGDELKLTPSSLYRTFTDKHTLFLRALDHYRATESTQARRRLEASDRPVREVLREWMLWLVTCPAAGESGRGCFVVNTATELGATDAQVHERTEAAFAVTRQALHAVLAEGRERGELAADLDIDGAVELLFTTVLGLRVRERAGHGMERLTVAIDGAIRSLGDEPAQAG